MIVDLSHLTVPLAAAMREGYHAPIGRSGPNVGCRSAAVWSLTGVKRKSEPRPNDAIDPFRHF